MVKKDINVYVSGRMRYAPTQEKIICVICGEEKNICVFTTTARDRSRHSFFPALYLCIVIKKSMFNQLKMKGEQSYGKISDLLACRT